MLTVNENHQFYLIKVMPVSSSELVNVFLALIDSITKRMKLLENTNRIIISSS